MDNVAQASCLPRCSEQAARLRSLLGRRQKAVTVKAQSFPFDSIVNLQPEPIGRLAFRRVDPILTSVHFHHEPDPSDRVLTRWVRTLGPELHRRYGLEGGCTHQQVAKTAADLAIDAKILPYMYAAFVHEDELPAVRAQMPEVDWEEVDERSNRIIDGLQHTSHYEEEDGFRENWRGITG